MARKTAEDAARTRTAVLDAALVVFAERGYAATQLEEIASRASVTRGAVYHHFDDKAQLFLCVLRERWDSVMSPILAELDREVDAPLRLRAFVLAYLLAMDNDEQARALMKMSLSGDTSLAEFTIHMSEKLDVLASWRHKIALVLREAQPRGLVNARAKALLSSLLGYSVWSALHNHADDTCRSTKPESANNAERRAMVEAFLRGVL